MRTMVENLIKIQRDWATAADAEDAKAEGYDLLSNSGYNRRQAERCRERAAEYRSQAAKTAERIRATTEDG